MQLLDNEVHIWRTDVNAVSSELITRYPTLMLEEERERMQRFKFEDGRTEYSIARALVRTTLSRYIDRAPEDWVFSKGKYGKPEIDQQPRPLRFNLSHSNGQIVCAVTRSFDIGIDIENITRSNDLLNIAECYFSEQEVRDLFALTVNQQADRFFDYWTLKEAYIKARGDGITMGLCNFSFSFDEAGAITISCHKQLQEQPADWCFWLFNPEPGHRMALALKAGDNQSRQGLTPQLKEFKVVPLA